MFIWENYLNGYCNLSFYKQVQLEKIRESGSEVRWQHEEDVDECPTCHTVFSLGKKKVILMITITNYLYYHYQ